MKKFFTFVALFLSAFLFFSIESDAEGAYSFYDVTKTSFTTSTGDFAGDGKLSYQSPIQTAANGAIEFIKNNNFCVYPSDDTTITDAYVEFNEGYVDIKVNVDGVYNVYNFSTSNPATITAQNINATNVFAISIENFRQGKTSVTLKSIRIKYKVSTYNAQNAITIKFDANGGTGTMADQNTSINADHHPILNKNFFTRENFKFVGWSTSSDTSYLSSNLYQDRATLTGRPCSSDVKTVTFYAIWERVKPEDDDVIEIINQYKNNYYGMMYSQLSFSYDNLDYSDEELDLKFPTEENTWTTDTFTKSAATYITKIGYSGNSRMGTISSFNNEGIAANSQDYYLKAISVTSFVTSKFEIFASNSTLNSTAVPATATKVGDFKVEVVEDYETAIYTMNGSYDHIIIRGVGEALQQNLDSVSSIRFVWVKKSATSETRIRLGVLNVNAIYETIFDDVKSKYIMENKGDYEVILESLAKELTYGIEVTCASKTKKYYISDDNVSNTETAYGTITYVTISLGDVVNNLSRANDEFSIRGFIKYNDVYYYITMIGNTSTTLMKILESYHAMSDEYLDTGMTIGSMVHDYYNYFHYLMKGWEV